MTLLRCAALALLTFSAASQNLIKNGDFENGLTSWTLKGNAHDPKADAFNTHGSGVSKCFSCRPGPKSGTSLTPFVLSQKVPVVKGPLYVAYFDFALTHPGAKTTTRETVQVEVWLGGRRYTRHWFSTIAVNQVHRIRVAHLPGSGWTGPVPLEIKIYRTQTANATTPIVYIDNVYFGTFEGPSFQIDSERKIGTKIQLRFVGRLSHDFAIFASPKRITPLPVPGFRGKWALGNPILLVHLGRFSVWGGHGVAGVNLNIPNDPSIRGQVVWLQGMEVLRNGPVWLGEAQGFTAY